MKSVLFGIILIGAASLGSVSQGAGGAQGATQVSITNFAFVPATITIPVGSGVTWTNQDSVPHTSTSDARGWDSNFIIKGKSFSLQFNMAGTFTYHCSVHPGMKAVVIVK